MFLNSGIFLETMFDQQYFRLVSLQPSENLTAWFETTAKNE